MTQSIGVLQRLWRFPVKSMGGEALDAATVTETGLVGDRAFALVDTATGKVVSGKSVSQFPKVMACRAAFVDPPQLERPLPPVMITLANGVTVRSDADDRDIVLSSFFQRSVTLASQAPEGFTIDIAHPDLGAPPEQERPATVTSQKAGAALFAEMGMPSPVPEGSFFDAFPVSILTTQTLQALKAAAPDSDFDERRFRMNFIVETPLQGFVENDWIERTLQVGDGLKLHVVTPDPRCIMINLAQDGLPRDPMVLRTIVQQNRIDVLGAQRPCAGVYSVVAKSGLVRVGDPITIV